ncbi:hypothetical protein [Vitiosangium sp. GDMCC 1.1324]|uniref:hypothetical protein n=1 Tax=Vitiosangium sp. (strain GDMCC 1.1324) TaxID=2138576 RepID=UPI000D346043|nr:hypothetical protein [Vitiosangium sp. GDMCC 1.1324]PTL78918.1 hypothetical protein DAT35_35405 [Vitiosangium sp. GDMCC 1.1324]
MAVVDLDKFRRERTYRTQAPGSQVLKDLDVLRNLDTHHERLQQQTGHVGCGALLAAVALLILVFNTNAFEEPTLHPVAAWGSGLLLVTGVIAFILRFRHARLNLEDRRYQLATRLVQMIQADTAPEELMTVEIDLRPATDSDKLSGKGKTPGGWDVKHYVDRWLSLQGRLMDGTHLRVEMTERTDQRSRTKRSRSGKYKTKSKTQSDALVRVRLQVKPEKYQHLGRLGARARNAVQLPQGTRLRALSVEEDRLDMTILVSQSWSADNKPPMVNGVQVVAMSLLSLYQLLHLSRAIDKRAAHA